jgi:hypothetical protein
MWAEEIGAAVQATVLVGEKAVLVNHQGFPA